MPDNPKKDASASLPDRLATDPKNPPDLTLLQGWLGASSEAGHRRLYLDPELCNSLEIPEDAIVHTQEIPRDTNPLGGDWVWVKAEAAVKQGPGVERMYARFLRGQIQQDYFAGGGGAAAGGGAAGGGMVGGPLPTSPIVCQRTIFNCPTQQTWCRPSRLTICASAFVICRPPVLATFACPSAVDACPSAPGGCDPFTIVQTGTIFQQPADFGGVAGGGLGFDPGVAAGGFAAGGMVGGPGVAGPIGPIRTFFNCPSQTFICRPSVLTICASSFVICRPTIGIACVPSAAWICQTRICPSAVDACPSAPGGCDPFTIVQTGTIFQQPADFGGVAGGGLGFDPGIAAGGMVGGPGVAGLGVAGPVGPIRTFFQCPSRVTLCRPSIVTICNSSPIICRPSAALHCPTLICPSAVDACPSAPGGCDPWTVVQTGTIFQQPADFGGVAGGGLGFDPGLAAGGFGGAGGGMVGGPGPAGAFGPVGPIRTFFNCPSRVVLCQPSVVTICTRQVICPTQPVICRPTLGIACVPSAAVHCPTLICPSAVDACPSAPGGCDPFTVVQTGTIVQQPVDFGGAGGGLGFDPGIAAGGGVGGGMVGGPAPGAALHVTSPLVCHLVTHNILQCRPTFTLQQCRTFMPICWFTRQPQCVTQFCPTLPNGCPSGPICGGGGF